MSVSSWSRNFVTPWREFPACPFCAIVAGHASAEGLIRWEDDVVAFTPLHPVTLGHILVAPAIHVTDFMTDPAVSARVMAVASEMARSVAAAFEAEGVNLITSAGEAATQSVFHLHVHIVPRRAGDGLQLPWTGQRLETNQ